MSQFIPIEYARVLHSLSLTGDPQPMAVTYGIHTSDFATVDVDVLAADLHDAFGDEVMPELCNVYSLTATEVALQRAADSYPVSGTSGASIGVATGAVAGGEVGTATVQNTAYLVHKRSAFGGRRGRGRFYLPGVAEGDVSPTGAVGAGRLGTLQTAMTDFLARFGAGGLANVTPVILHSYAIVLGVPVPDPTTLPDPYEITNLVVDGIVATQRRRLRP